MQVVWEEVKTILLVMSQQRHLFLEARVMHLQTYLAPFIKQQTDASTLWCTQADKWLAGSLPRVQPRMLQRAADSPGKCSFPGII